jgi:uncharacterized protein YcfJ
MNRATIGFWDVVDICFRSIGRGAVGQWRRQPRSADEAAGYALIGAGLVWAVFGAVVGFGLSGHSRNMATMEGAILGCFLGACMGVFFGSFVEAVDDTIHSVLRSLNSK